MTTTCKVYRDDGKHIVTFSGDDVGDCLRKLDLNPGVVLAAKAGGLKIRIEDKNRSGCWLVVGPPSAGKLR